MDNLTHSLVGALLGQMGLKKKTGLAMPTLILAANLPDIDASCLLWLDGVEHLGFRRGITHGPIAMLLLPILLWGVMLAYDRWRRGRDGPAIRRVPVDKRWLLVLAYIGCLSHPALDWLNTYGVRLLEPFSSQWFYGDTLFIIDLWVWVALGLSLWLSVRRERAGVARWNRPAWIGFAAVSAYIFANGLITGAAVRSAVGALHGTGKVDVLAVASPPPIAFWHRDIFWRAEGRYGSGRFALGKGIEVESEGTPTGMGDPRLAAWSRGDPAAQAFLFWSRMPIAEADGDDAIVIRDQRYTDPLAQDRFLIRLTDPEGVGRGE